VEGVVSEGEVAGGGDNKNNNLGSDKAGDESGLGTFNEWFACV